MTGKSNAQATDFAQYDCDGQYHSLFEELDSGKIVVMEFVMDCQLCVDAGVALEALFTEFHQQYPGILRVYQFAYSPLLDCIDMKMFRDTNSFQSEVFEENSHLMAHYGGFGMPTIGVAAGSNHQDIYSSVGFIASDTAQLGTVLRNYMTTISVNELNPDKFISANYNSTLQELNVISNSNNETVLELFNSAGSKVMTTTMKNILGEETSISLNNFSPGLYFAHFNSSKRTSIIQFLISK